MIGNDKPVGHVPQEAKTFQIAWTNGKLEIVKKMIKKSHQARSIIYQAREIHRYDTVEFLVYFSTS